MKIEDTSRAKITCSKVEDFTKLPKEYVAATGFIIRI